MSTWQRVRDTSGHKISIRADVDEGHPRGLKDGMTVLEEPAEKNGVPLPPKYRTPLGTPLPGSKTDRKRAKQRAEVPAPTEAPHEPVPTADPQPEAPTPSGHELADTQMED